jgi:hypothetical protein
MNSIDNFDSAADSVGGEPLSGSGFEDEQPDQGFTETEDSTE